MIATYNLIQTVVQYQLNNFCLLSGLNAVLAKFANEKIREAGNGT